MNYIIAAISCVVAILLIYACIKLINGQFTKNSEEIYFYLGILLVVAISIATITIGLIIYFDLIK